MKLDRAAVLVFFASMLAACGGARPEGARTASAIETPRSAPLRSSINVPVSTTQLTLADEELAPAPRVGKAQRDGARDADGLFEPKRTPSREGTHAGFGGAK